MSLKTSIPWTNITWNPVYGCLNNCEFCYARKIARRFWRQIALAECDDIRSFDKISNDIVNFKPIFMKQNFNREFPKKPSRIFVNSMSEISYWEPEWMEKVLNKIKEYPQHRFLFLTKKLEIYKRYNFPFNCYLGVTITNETNMKELNKISKATSYNFLSIEPILEKIDIDAFMYIPDWIIIGAETGNQKNKITPKKEWIENIRMFCQYNNIPYFEKNSIQKIVDRDLIQEYPEVLKC